MDVLKESIAGIQHEIYKRTWKIHGLVQCYTGVEYTGPENRMVKPVKDKLSIVDKVLKLRAEVKKLQAIKTELIYLHDINKLLPL